MPKVKFIKINDKDEYDYNKLLEFNCGKDQFNDFLKNDAENELYNGESKTFLFFIEDDLIGFFSLKPDRVHVIKKSRLRKDGRYARIKNRDYTNIPSIQIHHLAIDVKYQGQRNGEKLMDFILLIIRKFILKFIAAELVTVYSTPDAVGFYEKQGFVKTGDQKKDTINYCMALHTDNLYLIKKDLVEK